MRSPASVWSLPIVSMLLFTGCTQAPPAAPPVDPAAIGAAVDSINVAFKAAVAARDTAAILTFYAEDAWLMPANAPRAVGKAEMGRAWAEFLAMPGLELIPRSEHKMVSEAGDMVVDLGSFEFRFDPAPGRSVTDRGKYSTVFRKVGGEWKIVADMFNSDIPVTGQ
jgi:ketosteroid isomerase-like protein